MDFQDRFELLREKKRQELGLKRLTNARIEKEAGLSNGMLRRFFNGEVEQPSAPTLIKLAAYFDVPVSCLVDQEIDLVDKSTVDKKMDPDCRRVPVVSETELLEFLAAYGNGNTAVSCSEKNEWLPVFLDSGVQFGFVFPYSYMLPSVQKGDILLVRMGMLEDAEDGDLCLLGVSGKLVLRRVCRCSSGWILYTDSNAELPFVLEERSDCTGMAAGIVMDLLRHVKPAGNG